MKKKIAKWQMVKQIFILENQFPSVFKKALSFVKKIVLSQKC